MIYTTGMVYLRVLLISNGELWPPFIASLTCSGLAPHVSSMSTLVTLDMGGPTWRSCFLSVSLDRSFHSHAQFGKHGRVPCSDPLHAPVRAVAHPALEPAFEGSARVSLMPLNSMSCAVRVFR